MGCRQHGELNPPAVEIRLGANEEGVRPLVQKTCEGRLDLPAGALRTLTCSPVVRAAAAISLNVVSVLVAFTVPRYAINFAFRAASFLLCRSSVRRHHSEIMFSVLVVVLGRDQIAALSFSLSQRQI